jgi:hypothetical protein
MRKDFFDDERELIFPTDSSGLDRNLNSCPRVLATLEPRAEISQRLRRYYEDSLR